MNKWGNLLLHPLWLQCVDMSQHNHMRKKGRIWTSNKLSKTLRYESYQSQYRFCHTIILLWTKKKTVVRLAIIHRLLLWRQAEGMTSSSVDFPLPAPLPFSAAAMHHIGVINKHTPGSIQHLAGYLYWQKHTEKASTLTFLNASLVISSVNQFGNTFAAFRLQCACGDHGDSIEFSRLFSSGLRRCWLKNDVAASGQQSKRAVFSSLRDRWLIKAVTVPYDVNA